MKKIYDKSQICFTMLWILAYVMGTSVADVVSEQIGSAKSVTFLFHAGMCLTALVWLRRHRLFRKYGLCRSHVKASRFLYYIPLFFLASCNVWHGLVWNMPVTESLFYFCSMCCVGFLEELIFRGFLFEAMRGDGVRSAMVVSSLTFGIGHIVNLFNGSGADLLSNLCQVCYATAFGFMCVVLFYRGKSLLPCILTHSAVNALSVFANESNRAAETVIMTAVVLFAAAAVYGVVLLKTLPEPEPSEEQC